MLPEDVRSEAVWEFFEGTRNVNAALPIYGVITLSSSGSESNASVVLQNDSQ